MALKISDKELQLIAKMIKRQNLTDYVISKLTPSPTPSGARKSKKRSPLVNYIQKWTNSMKTAQTEQEKIQLAKEITEFLADRYGDPKSDEMREYVIKVMNRYFRGSGISDKGYRRYINALRRGTRVESKQFDAMKNILEGMGFSFEDFGFMVESTKSRNYVKLYESKGE